MTRPLRPLSTVVVALSLLAACGGAGDAPGAAAPSAPSPTARAAAPTPDGRAACGDAGRGPGVDGAALRSFVRRRASQLRDCYQRALKRDASAGGRATVRFTIGSCGEVTEVAIAARRGKVDDAAACAVRAMQAWRTPFRPADPVTVEYPLSFSASM